MQHATHILYTVRDINVTAAAYNSCEDWIHDQPVIPSSGRWLK
jgi:hypothetical protein